MTTDSGPPEPPGPSPRRLIVNADDFGRTPGINRGVLEAHERGIVTSATLMVAYPAAEPAVEAARAHPSLGVGLHVAVTGGRPVCDPSTVPSLVDGQGRFPRKPEGLGGARADDVAREVAAQLARFHALVGRAPTHLDSHHHSHRTPVVLDVLIDVARQHGLPMRNASPTVAVALGAAGVATTDAFVEDFFDAQATVVTLHNVLGRLGPGVTELMCHPAYVDDELRSSSGYATPRMGELAALTDPGVVAAVAASGVKLGPFTSL